MHGADVFVLYYYYRNPFNKGVKLAQLADGVVKVNQTYLRQQDHNAGWDPLLAMRDDGSSTATYLSDVQAEVSATDPFPTVEALLEHRDTEVRGTWLDDARTVSVDAGLMPAFQQWLVSVPDPSASDVNKPRHLSHSFSPGIVTRAWLGMRVDSVQFGAAYAQQLLSDQVSAAAGSTAGKAFQVFSGFVGIDRLFGGTDMRVAWTRARYDGTVTDVDGPQPAQSVQDAVELQLITQYRFRYGARYRGYGLREAAYAYYAPPNVKTYAPIGSATVDAKVHRGELFLGYSNLDYLSKYETRYFGPSYDIELGLGGAVSTWNAVSMAGQTVDGTVDFVTSLTARLGLVWYRRFVGMRGAGIMTGLGYQAVAMTNGIGASKPSDRKDETDSEKQSLARESLTVQAPHHQLFHGPYFLLGLSY